MSKYLVTYDELFDEVFQCEISEETAAKLDPKKCQMSDAAFPNIPVKSRFRSVRHPGWGIEQ